MRIAVLAVALLAPVAARADAPSAPAPAAPAPTAAPAPHTPRRNTRQLCGCASSRFLARGPVVLDGDTALSAWLHDGAVIGGFDRDDAGALVPATLPLSVTPVGADGGAALVVVKATGDDPREHLLGISRRGEATPRDVIAARCSTALAPPADDLAAPALTALWLRPLERRERRDCGAWLTLRTAFEVREGTPAPAAFAVRDVDTGVSRLVDARHVGAFGIGYVAACEHGFPVEARPQTLEITPVSSTGTRGEPWVLKHDGQGLADVVRVSSPASADEDLLTAPFPVPGAPRKPYSLLSVGGIWALSAAATLVCGVVGFFFWRFKRRHMRDVPCTACGARIPMDVLDDKTDGFFCPSCGAAGVWKGKRRVDVEVTRL